MWQLPSGEQIRVNEATVTFYARDLTDKDLRRIYNIVRGYVVGGEDTRGLEDIDEHLWKLVQDKGGPSQKHGSKGEFWQEILEEIDQKYSGKYTTPRGVEKRYRSILKRLQSPQATNLPSCAPNAPPDPRPPTRRGT